MQAPIVDDELWILIDELWTLIEPLLPPSKPRRKKNPGRLPVSNRAALTEVASLVRTGFRSF
ncbi:TPA: hypothetical protein ACUNF5_007133 [Burkholderia orbicola]|uniref:hypothetical protein n=1 Tax=Burkholderia orbicola TaxID=2978683 RepID=UPI00163B5D51|nr:hypothetical protein [Burkholderia orbicola]MDN7535515.1 hypothetical protein [Burkholderia orbicola]